MQMIVLKKVTIQTMIRQQRKKRTGRKKKSKIKKVKVEIEMIVLK